MIKLSFSSNQDSRKNYQPDFTLSIPFSHTVSNPSCVGSKQVTILHTCCYYTRYATTPSMERHPKIASSGFSILSTLYSSGNADRKHCSDLLSVAVIQHSDQKLLVKEKGLLTYNSESPCPSQREVRAVIQTRRKAEIIDDGCLLGHSQLPFLKST